MRLLWRAGLTALCCSLLIGASAQAATPFSLDASPGAERPAVVIDGAGTAHLAWNVRRTIGLGDQVRYCRLPRGAAACDVRQTFLPDANLAFHAPSIFLRGGGLVIVSGRSVAAIDDATWVTIASGLGSGFDAGRTLGNIDAQSSALGPDTGRIASIAPKLSASSDVKVQVASIAPGAPVTTSAAAFPLNEIADSTNYSQIGFLNPQSPFFTYERDNVGTYVRLFNAAFSGYNIASNWNLGPHLIPGEFEPALAANPSNGGYVMTKAFDSATQLGALNVRNVSDADGQPGPAKRVTEIGDGLTGSALALGPTGTLTAIWHPSSAETPLYAAQAGPGGEFSRASTLVASATPHHAKVATAADGGGIVVWDDNGAAGTISAVAIPAGGPVPDPVPAAPGPSGPAPEPEPPAACKLTLAPGIVASAREVGTRGCWVSASKKKGEQKFTYDGTVDVNGIVLAAAAGKNTGIKVDLKARTLTAPKGVQQKAGAIVLSTREVSWDFSSPKGGKVTEAFTNLQSAGPGGQAVKLLGFSVVGEAKVTFSQSGPTLVEPQLAMPFPFDGLTAATTLTVTAAGGLDLSGVAFSIQEAWIGALQVKQLQVSASSTAAGDDAFFGNARVILPGLETELEVTVAFENGDLTVFAATASGPPAFPFAITPFAHVTSLGFRYENNEKAFAVAGGAALGVPTPTGPFFLNALPQGSTTGGVPPGFRLEINKATKSAKIGFGAEFRFGTSAETGFKFGDAGVTLDTGERLLSGQVRVGIGSGTVGINGQVSGKVRYDKGAFFFSGDINVCLLGCLETEVYVGGSPSLEGGVGGCFKLDLVVTTLELQVGYLWNDGFTAGVSCNQTAYQPAIFRDPNAPVGPAAKQDSPKVLGADVFELPVHPDPVDVIAAKIDVQAKARANAPKVWSAVIKGKPGGGAPAIKLTEVTYAGGVPLAAAPGDRVVIESDSADATRPVRSGDAILTPDPGQDAVRLTFLQRGMDSAAQSPSNLAQGMRIVSIGGNAVQFGARTSVRVPGQAARMQASGAMQFARDVAPAKVSGRLSGSARKRTIRWQATALAAGDRSLTLIEADKSGQLLQSIRSTPKASGAATWQLAEGPGGKRKVVAQVRNFQGTVVDEQVLATFTAPPSPKPSKPTGLRLSLGKKGKLKASWSGPKNSSKAVVEVTVADGRGFTLSTTKRSITIPGVARNERVSVRVSGINRRGERGRAASAKRGRR